MTRRNVFLVVLAVMICVGAVSCGSDFFVDPQLTLITVNPPSPSILTGFTQQFTATGTYDDGSKKLLGSNIVTWSTSNALVLIVDNNGKALAKAEGSATVSASASTVTGSTTVTVVKSSLTGIVISPLAPTLSLATQTTQQFAATGTFADGTQSDITNYVTWTSSDTNTATIDAKGLATGKVAGTVTITAQSGTVQATTTLIFTK